ncbi:MAG: GNAT family N-acetyltransferase [Dehalococcoidales bacterium]|nr:MAG: GNAT family N-acetyltransferase [Dehalococcoidales bacterium]
MDKELTLKVKKYRDLSEQELADIIELCSQAFETDYRPFLDTFTDPTHVLGYYENTLVSHALWITRWLQVGDSPMMRTAFVEGVATEQAFRKKGYALVVMKRLAEEIFDYEIGGLCTGSPDFYSRLGWQVWKGPLFARKDNESIPSQEGASVMVLHLTDTPVLNLSAPLSIEWREGEVW